MPGVVFQTFAYGLNDKGQVVGSFQNSTGFHGFLDTAGSFTQIDPPGGVDITATGINSAGQIVGSFFTDGTGQHGFIDTGGSFTQIDVPGGSDTDAEGINDRGQIVGTFANSTGTHGFLATPNGMGVGDPHLTTFDSRPYSFYAVGEFVLAQSTVAGNSFDVQIQTRPWHAGSVASIISEVAAKLGDRNVTFDLDRAHAGESFVWIDGHPASLSAGNRVVTLDAGRIIEISPSDYQVIWNTGETLDVTNAGSCLEVTASLSPKDGPGSVEGLLGSDSGWDSDFQLPNGAILDPQISMSEIDGVFADAWRVTDATSLFNPGAADVPEPASLSLLIVSLIGLAAIRRRAPQAKLINGENRAGLVESSADLEQTRVALIAAAWSTATLRFATQLLLADEGERGAKLFVLDNRRLRNLAKFVEGPIRQFDAAVTDCQPTIGIIDDGHPLADRRLGLLAWLQNEHDLVVLQGQRL